ncbi:hypothetical protein LS77_007150 [Helicobacter bilis]|uniref:Uncharacterized protein n=3 Tax=Helicobacter bilis TaxID=37372 RepID=A0A6D2C6Y4_9HELI|nr:hypothetical protein [Helicobacter bilis]EMZ40803.1 hypothetical protein C826_00637 [Helicobacter bilis WiWa]TLE03123.1 hypothetical protein LS76_010605 [Helicobacter bilis]TLE04073.1 hypothetical protein LS77_007150 [Helicobacter bilis]
MKKFILTLWLCVCVVYGDEAESEYFKNKAAFIEKNFDSTMALEIQELGAKSETSKLLFKVAMTPLLYESGLEGDDSNGGWGEIDYRDCCGGFWERYYDLEGRVKKVCGTLITETRTKEIIKKDIIWGKPYTAYEDYTIHKQNYTPAEQKCIKSLATLELEINRDIVNWGLERMKADGTYDYDAKSYQLADTLWEKFNRYAKLGLIKDYNKPGMDKITKGLFYIWVVGEGSQYSKFDSIDSFLVHYGYSLGEYFSFLYESMETNLKKLEELLKEKGVYLSAKEYEEAVKKQQEADKLEKIELLREFIFKSGDIAYNEDKEKLSHHLNKCMGLSDDGATNKATSWGGEYAELLDKKYYNYNDNSKSYTTKAEIENTPLYKQLAWCALRETLDREVSYRREKIFEENWRYGSLYGIEIECAVNAILMKKWDTMEKKYPYTDYESAIKNPWYKDGANANFHK